MKPLLALALTTPFLTAPLLQSAAKAQDKKADPFASVTVAENFGAAKPLAELKEGGALLTPRLYKTVFFGKPALWAGAFAENPTKKKLACSYFVALFDKDRRLVAVASQDADLDPGAKDLQLGSCLLKLPEEEVKRIAFAQWRILVAEK